MKLLRREPYTLLRSCLITLDLLFMRDGFGRAAAPPDGPAPLPGGTS
ncbi:MAG TPA: hypothetical protein VMN03_02895 [Burkholderiales bacterium]|nr:hypothetical protein [Burkholderiales bacterium]